MGQDLIIILMVHQTLFWLKKKEKKKNSFLHFSLILLFYFLFCFLYVHIRNTLAPSIVWTKTMTHAKLPAVLLTINFASTIQIQHSCFRITYMMR